MLAIQSRQRPGSECDLGWAPASGGLVAHTGFWGTHFLCVSPAMSPAPLEEMQQGHPPPVAVPALPVWLVTSREG